MSHILGHALKSKKPGWLLLIAIRIGYFLSILDTTLIHISVPAFPRELHTDLIHTSWIMHAYHVTFAVLLVLVGQLADFLGYKRLLLASLIMLALGSLLCTLAPDLSCLVAARVLQALGGHVGPRQ